MANPDPQVAQASQAVSQGNPGSKGPGGAEALQKNQQDLSLVPAWNCRVEGKPTDQQWTVGETFILHCEGPTAKFLSTELVFRKNEKFEYQLNILEVQKQTDNSLDMKVTSYVPGSHNFQQLLIADQGKVVVKVDPLALTVKSVIKDPKQKPFGPIMAMKLTYPSWLWIAMAVTLGLSLFFGLFRWRRRIQMKKVLEELKQHNTALGPFNQFNKDIRRLSRNYIFGKKIEWPAEKKHRYIENLNEIFRMYLLREFYVPALDWNSSLVLKTVAKQDRKRFQLYGVELRQFLKELDRGLSDVEKLTNFDCKQLTGMSQKVTQSIWQARR